jgi:glycosyltransferase involved in cell wall biosynthesis
MIATTAAPRLSVIVRSYNRLACLAELLERLLRQDHDAFEIVVVEQSVERPPADVERVEALARDPRVRLSRHEPLGGPAARNAGVRNARGEILVFIDDDDLPLHDDWLRRHEAAYADPQCIGVTGRHVYEGTDETVQPYANMKRAERNVLSLNVLKFQRVYVRTTKRKHVTTVHGTNASLRRSAVERFGLWDECTPIEDELSFVYRMQAGMRPDEYLLFEPDAPILRRLDVGGGMAKRALRPEAFARKLFTFLHNITGHYYPARFTLLYPVYFGYAAYRVADWIWSMSRRHTTLPHRIGALARFYVKMPFLWSWWLAQHLGRRIRHGRRTDYPTLVAATR